MNPGSIEVKAKRERVIFRLSRALPNFARGAPFLRHGGGGADRNCVGGASCTLGISRMVRPIG